MRLGIVFSGGKVHGPTPVDERGLGGDTDRKIPFMVVPAPQSPYFPEVDFDTGDSVGFKDRTQGFWSISCTTQDRADEIIRFIKEGHLQ